MVRRAVIRGIDTGVIDALVVQPAFELREHAGMAVDGLTARERGFEAVCPDLSDERFFDGHSNP